MQLSVDFQGRHVEGGQSLGVSVPVGTGHFGVDVKMLMDEAGYYDLAYLTSEPGAANVSGSYNPPWAFVSNAHNDGGLPQFIPGMQLAGTMMFPRPTSPGQLMTIVISGQAYRLPFASPEYKQDIILNIQGAASGAGGDGSTDWAGILVPVAILGGVVGLLSKADNG